jgi:GNAT superfamily N-acetyltransferase
MLKIRRAGSHESELVCRFAAAAAFEDQRAATLTPEIYRRDGVGSSAVFETWILEEGGKPRGQAVVHKGYDFEHSLPTLVLVHLYVEPGSRRGGIARTLISHVASRARDVGAREVIITTGIDNAIARRFFEAVGARETDVAQYRIGQDAIGWLAEEIS